MTNKKIILLFNGIIITSLVLFVFIYDNSRKTIPRFDFITLPYIFRFYDSFIIALSGVLIFIKNGIISKRKINYVKLNKIAGCIILISLISILINGKINNNFGEIAYFEGFMKFMRPFIIIFILTNIYHLKVSYNKIFKILIVILIANALIGYWQIIFQDARNDNVDALFRSAHFLTTFTFICLFGIYSYFSKIQKKLIMYISIIFLLIPAIFAEHIRAIAVLLITIGFYIFYKNYFNRNFIEKLRGVIVSITLIAITAGGLLYLTLQIQPNIYDKFSKALKFVSKEVAFISGYKSLPKFFYDNPHIILFGKGPGQYGSYVSFSKSKVHITQSPVYKEIRRNAGLVSISVLSPSLDNPSTNLFAIIAEYGIIVLILFILYFRVLFKTIHRNTHFKDSWKKDFFDLYMIYIITFSAVDAGYGWENMLSIIPFFVLIGLQLRENKIFYDRKRFLSANI